MAIVLRSIINQDENKIMQTFLYGNPTYSVSDNKLNLDAIIKYIMESKRFDRPIFSVKESWPMHNRQNETPLASILLSLLYYHYYYLSVLLLLVLPFSIIIIIITFLL